MTTAAILLLFVGLAVWLSMARPSASSLTSSLSGYDRERQLAELRAMSGSRADVHL